MSLFHHIPPLCWNQKKLTHRNMTGFFRGPSGGRKMRADQKAVHKDTRTLVDVQAGTSKVRPENHLELETSDINGIQWDINMYILYIYIYISEILIVINGPFSLLPEFRLFLGTCKVRCSWVPIDSSHPSVVNQSYEISSHHVKSPRNGVKGPYRDHLGKQAVSSSFW